MRIYLGLGSNLDNREASIRLALNLLERDAGHIVRVSSYYYSEPWGFESTNSFCNVVALMETTLTPEQLLDVTQLIERTQGRREKSVGGIYHDRIIDIDLLSAYDEQGVCIVRNTPSLTLPHPLMEEREFVMSPLREIFDK